jgi:hypothetical protein
LKPELFDVIHRFWRLIMHKAATLDQFRTPLHKPPPGR